MLVLMILCLLFVFVENVFWDNNYFLFCYGVWRISLFFFHKEINFINVLEKCWSWWFFVSVENVFWDNNNYLFCYWVWIISFFFFHKEIIFPDWFGVCWPWWFFVGCDAPMIYLFAMFDYLKLYCYKFYLFQWQIVCFLGWVFGKFLGKWFS